MYVVHLCMPTCECKHPEFREEVGAGITGSYELPDMDVKELNLGPPEGQQTLLTSRPSLQSQIKL